MSFWAFLSAIVGGLIVAFFREFAFKLWWEKRRKSEVYKKYAELIAKTSLSLYYRFHEIVHKKNTSYLSARAPRNRFHQYKFDSTCYRLCCFLGAVRAIELEAREMKFQNRKFSDIEQTISRINQLLADGQHIELTMLSQIGELGRLQNVAEQIEKNRDARNYLVRIMEELPDTYRLNSKEEMSHLSWDEKQKVARTVSHSFQKYFPEFEDISSDEDVERLCCILSGSYVLIYRDWQDAIGDIMICRREKGNRDYDIIGFRNFVQEDLMNDAFVKIVQEMFRNLQIDDDSATSTFSVKDFREDQISNILWYTATLICELHENRLSKPYIPENCYDDCKKFLESTES